MSGSNFPGAEVCATCHTRGRFADRHSRLLEVIGGGSWKRRTWRRKRRTWARGESVCATCKMIRQRTDVSINHGAERCVGICNLVGRPVCATCKMILVLVLSKHLEILLAGQDSWAGSVTLRGVNRRLGPDQVGLVRCSGPFGRGAGMSGRRPGVTAAGPVMGRVMMA
jgi:hypothetical protein